MISSSLQHPKKHLQILQADRLTKIPTHGYGMEVSRLIETTKDTVTNRKGKIGRHMRMDEKTLDEMENIQYLGSILNEEVRYIVICRNQARVSYCYGTTEKTEQIMKHLKIFPYCNIDYYGCETCTCDGSIENMKFKLRCSRRFM